MGQFRFSPLVRMKMCPLPTAEINNMAEDSTFDPDLKTINTFHSYRFEPKQRDTTFVRVANPEQDAPTIAVICVTKSRTGDYDFRACARARGFRGSTFSVGRIRFAVCAERSRDKTCVF